jgi:hypothetical protein
VRLLLFGMLNWSSHWYRAEGPMSVDQLAEAAVNMLLNAPCTTGSTARKGARK